MENMHGFAFDDVQSIKGAGIDTKAFLRAGLIAFTEGALLHGVFHGDLHAGNVFVQPDGVTALLDFGITGRFNEEQRKAFMRLLIAGTSGNVRQQIIALRDLGAFPADTDIDAVIDDLDLEGPTKDPTKMSSEQLTHEMQDLTKKLLGYGARAPKELMLFVKNLMFLDGATALLAPDLDILGEIQHVYQYFVQTYGAQIISELGISQDALNLDMDAVRSSMGVSDRVDELTYQDILKRREIIKKRMMDKEDE
jgi:ubiquinone biosynthesis protein